MKKAGIILFIVIIQFYLLPYRALYIYCASNHVSLSAISTDYMTRPEQNKVCHHPESNIGNNIPPKHNDRFADILSTPPVLYSYTDFQIVILQELLPAAHYNTYFAPLILPNSSRGSPLA
jgi:hypothetical protein